MFASTPRLGRGGTRTFFYGKLGASRAVPGLAEPAAASSPASWAPRSKLSTGVVSHLDASATSAFAFGRLSSGRQKSEAFAQQDELRAWQGKEKKAKICWLSSIAELHRKRQINAGPVNCPVAAFARSTAPAIIRVHGGVPS